MIDYVKRNDIFGDFRRNLSNSEIARKRGISRTTVVGLRKLYNATVNDKDNPEAYAELLRTEPKYKDREVDCPVLTDEIKSLIDQEVINNATKQCLVQDGGQVYQRQEVQQVRICPGLLHQAEVCSR